MNFPSTEELSIDSHRTKIFLNKHYPGFVEYLHNKYPFADTLNEQLYNYINRTDATCRPICPVCGNYIKYNNSRKYTIYCSRKCGNSDPAKLSRTEQTCLKKYGYKYATQSQEVSQKIKNTVSSKECQDRFKQTCLKRYGVDNPAKSESSRKKLSEKLSSQESQDKMKKTCLERYGVESVFQSKKIKDGIKLTNLERYGVEYAIQSDIIKDKFKQTNLERYGVEYPMQYNATKEKSKQTCLRKYGYNYYTQTPEFQNKINKTKRKNHTFNSSTIEEEFASYLDYNNIIYKRQCKSSEYPFNCDFYIPQYDLYIEIQACWTHGGHPYIEEKDSKQLEYWKSKQTKFYDDAIKTWSIRDVKKREIAKTNKLNYLEIFSNDINDAINCFQQFLR